MTGTTGPNDHANATEPGAAVGVYLRVSSALQARRNSIENQRPDIDRYLNAYGLSPYAWYEDEAVSGHWVPFGERPQGRRLLADARAGHVQLVLVWRLDRFGRNAVEILKAVEELDQAGARLVSLKESFDTRTPAGRLMLGVLAAMSEYEWASIMERSEAGVARKLDGGGWMGGQAPYGYKIEGTRPNSRLVIDDDPLITLPSGEILTAADVVRLVYRLCVDGETTLAIADHLTRLGVPTSFTRKGRNYRRRDRDEPAMPIWRANAVNWLLSNPTYKGEYIFGRRSNGSHGQKGTQAKGATVNGHGAAGSREIVTVACTPLVSVEEWDAAQAAMERNSLFSPRNAKHDYLLRGLMTCGQCGHGYIGDRYRYICYGARRPRILYGALAHERRCTSLPVRADELEADIWSDVEEALRNPGPVLAELAVQMSGQADHAAEIRAKLAATQQERDAKQSEKDLLLSLFRKGRISERDLDRQLDDIAREEVGLAKQIHAHTKQLASADEAAAKLAGADALLQELRDTLDSEPPSLALKRRILEKLVESITVGTEPDPDGEPGDAGSRRAVAKVRYRFEPPEDSGITTSIDRRARSRDRG